MTRTIESTGGGSRATACSLYEESFWVFSVLFFAGAGHEDDGIDFSRGEEGAHVYLLNREIGNIFDEIIFSVEDYCRAGFYVF